VVDATTKQKTDLSGLHILGVSVSEVRPNGIHGLIRDAVNGAGAAIDCASMKDQDIVQMVVDSARSGNPYDVVLICHQRGTALHYGAYEKLRSIPEAEQPGIVMLVPQSDHNEYRNVASVLGNPLSTNSLLECIAVSAGRTTSATCCVAEEVSHHESADVIMPDKEEALILFAEDNIVNQEVISMQLSALGYRAMLADDGREALELLKKHHFDLVLTDCHMPEMDGFELARTIRKEEVLTGAHIPIIAVTANAMSEELKRCIDCGMDGYLTKPLEMNELDRAIQKWLRAPALQTAQVVPDPDTTELTTGPATGSETEPETDSLSDGDAPAPVNPQVLSQLTGVDFEQCKPMLVKFSNASIPIVNELTAAAAEARFDDVTAQAHKLKSSAKTVGAEYFAELCVNMEKAGKDRLAEDLGLMATDLRDEFDRVKHYIDLLP